MTAAVQHLLESFNALSDAEKYEASVVLLRQVQQQAHGALPDEALVEAAEELFGELDAREAVDGRGEER
jgi:hypothetical protein